MMQEFQSPMNNEHDQEAGRREGGIARWYEHQGSRSDKIAGGG